MPGNIREDLHGRSTRAGLGFGVAMIVGVFGVGLMAATPASARVKCNNGFQVINGVNHATPYCQDLLLARVAREYGSKVSARAIMYKPLVKRQVCRLVGEDIRVQSTCNTVLPRRGGRF